MIAARVSVSTLCTALARLDQLIAGAMERAPEAYGPEASRDAFRGMYLNHEGFQRALIRNPGESLLWTSATPADDLECLANAFGVSGFDLDVLLIAAAPELDLKYERLFGFLQDDVTRKRPTVDLALNLLCDSPEMRILRRAHFSQEAPLFAWRMLRLIADPAQIEPPLLAHLLKPEPQALAYLIGPAGLDARLTSFCQLRAPRRNWAATVLSTDTANSVVRVAGLARTQERCPKLFFEGPSGGGQREAAEALALEVDSPLLIADLDRAAESRADFEIVLPALFSEARLRRAVLLIEAAETAPRHLLQSLVDENAVFTILSGANSLPGWFSIPFLTMSADASRRAWEGAASSQEVAMSPVTLETLCARLKLTPSQMEETACAAKWHAAWRGADVVETCDWMSAARSHTGQELATLARKVQPRNSWNDLVVPEDTKAQLWEICARVEQRHRVLEDWGFDARMSSGKGVNALFSGPSGSGKTMAVEILSSELQLDAYRIDLSGVVSKYIGETEKNLGRIFAAAENANAILFFDEADALFGKRSEVRDSHDRYANIEISYLLQKMEEYSGVAILATNLKQNLDEAFVRRLAFSIHFPFPDEISRREIWRNIWPDALPLAGDVDSAVLASRFQLSGGNIRNVALAAAFLASDRGEPVSLLHILHATRREYQKYGKQMQPGELLPNGASGVRS